MLIRFCFIHHLKHPGRHDPPYTLNFNCVETLLRPNTIGCIPSGRDCVSQCLNPHVKHNTKYTLHSSITWATTD